MTTIITLYHKLVYYACSNLSTPFRSIARRLSSIGQKAYAHAKAYDLMSKNFGPDEVKYLQRYKPRNGSLHRTTKNKFIAKMGSVCAYCGCPLTIETATIDHIMPRHKIRKDKYVPGEIRASIHKGKTNVNLSCYPCNQARGPIPIEHFIK